MKNNEKKTNLTFWLGCLAYLLPTFPLGYFWHLTIFKANYNNLGLYRPGVIIPMGLASMTIQGVLFSWAFPRLFPTGPGAWFTATWRSFLTYSFLAWSFVVLPVAAKYNMTSVVEFMKLETGFTFLQYLVVCPLIALVHARR